MSVDQYKKETGMMNLEKLFRTVKEYLRKVSHTG